jgi:hypothetical protein
LPVERILASILPMRSPILQTRLSVETTVPSIAAALQWMAQTRQSIDRSALAVCPTPTSIVRRWRSIE